jgi:parallel beta-helix repeat protein
MKNKSMICILILIVLVSNFIPIISSYKITSNNIIYVDDDNIEGPWDGTQEHPFQFIQDGVDTAVDSDTIYIFRGIYRGGVYVNKSIQIIGEKAEITKINDPEANSGLTIDAKNVELKNITFTNYYHNAIIIKKSYIHISNCIIGELNNYIHTGIYFRGGLVKYVFIENNTIVNCSKGIYPEFACTNIHVHNNTFIKAGSAITLGSASDYISNNTFIHGSAIYLRYGPSNTIVENNTFLENSHAIRTYDTFGKDSKIINNYFLNCSNAIYLDHHNDPVNIKSKDTSLEGLLIKNNIFQYSRISINCYHTSGIVIEHNSFENNTCAIYLYWCKETIIKNNFINNSKNIFYKNKEMGETARNYWDIPRIIYAIFGEKIVWSITGPYNQKYCLLWIPWITIDWNPAKESYDI